MEPFDMANTLSTIAPDDWGSSALLQLLLDSMSDPVFVKDRQHRWVAFNAAFCRLLGRSREELLGKSDPEIFPPDQVEVFWRLDDEIFASGEPNDNRSSASSASGGPRARSRCCSSESARPAPATSSST